MKFGSRMDVFLPPTPRLLVKAGDASCAPAVTSRGAAGDPGVPQPSDGAADARRLTPLVPRAADRAPRPARRLPAAEPVHDGNMFCGYACIVHAMRGEFDTAAPFIGFAIVLDMLDGRIARMTGTTSAFGVEFDSLADVISFGVAPAILSFAWGLQPLGRLGWAAGFLFVAAAAVRLARFNIQTGVARQALLRRHAEPGGGRRAGGDRLRVSARASPTGRTALPVLAW